MRKSSARMKACASPSGLGCTIQVREMPNCDPSPSIRSNCAWSSGVVMTRTSRMPASMRTESG